METSEKKSTANTGAGYSIDSFPLFQRHSEFVDETYDEAGKLPLLFSMMLVEVLSHYPKKGKKYFLLIPQTRLTPQNEYKTNYAVALML